MSGAAPVSATGRAWARDPLPWALAALLLLVFGMAWLKPLFAALFPALERPVYAQDSFLGLTLAHLKIVGLSSGFAVIVGVAQGFLPRGPADASFAR